MYVLELIYFAFVSFLVILTRLVLYNISVRKFGTRLILDRRLRQSKLLEHEC